MSLCLKNCDFALPILPILVLLYLAFTKAAKAGHLRSLHEFIDRSSHNYAVRVYSGKLKIDVAETIKGKKFYILNLPFYLIGDTK